MSKMYAYSGYLSTDNGDLLVDVLKTFLKSSKINDRYASDVQREIKYEDDNLELMIFDELFEGFLLQAELKGSIEDAENFIKTLTSQLISRKISYQFEWNEVDENGEQIGEEFEIKFKI